MMPVMRRSPAAIWAATSWATTTCRWCCLLLLPCETSIITWGRRPFASSASQLANGLRPQVMIDVSHGNSSKQHQRQIVVAGDVAAQIAGGDRRITGVMIESHLAEGRQDLVRGVAPKHGVSITDACLGFEQTTLVLKRLAGAVAMRRESVAG